MTAVADWMVAVATVGLPGAHVQVPSQPLEPADWHDLLELVAEQRLAGLLCVGVEAGTLPAPGEQAEQAALAGIELATQTLYLERATLEAVDVLRDAGLDPMVLKG